MFPVRGPGYNSLKRCSNRTKSSADMTIRNPTGTDAPVPAEEAEQRIVKTPGVCGGEACVRGTRLSVWGLVR